ncbi:MAG: hypothetical protein OEV01_09280 [Nitrospira sp.]|nr:hypothetical protein [Nitrospira sp.]MDH4302517.1 hypothetical protein [Nitrospira sp.]MDH5192361.1 hypothetical protein [Nitrospira sp.]
MPTSMRRAVPRTILSKRRVVNVQSLQLMIRSGVVRRADSMPPIPLRPARPSVPDEQQRAACKAAVQEQGWLSRVIFGPKPQPALTKRSSFDGGQ